MFTTAFFFFTGKQRVIAAATIGAVASLAPTLGPVIGGWITEVSSWHWLFYINLLPGIFVAVAVPMLVRIDQPELALLKGADYLSMLLLALFLGCLGTPWKKARAGTGSATAPSSPPPGFPDWPGWPLSAAPCKWPTRSSTCAP